MMFRGGTRFLLFPQSPAVTARPERVWVSPPAGSIGPGPSDERMYAVLPAATKGRYLPPEFLPPFAGRRLRPAIPDRDGHFDHIDPASPQFLAAHLYGCARFALDVWETHLGHRLRWWHADFMPLMELVPVIAWNNAHSGPGYIETGARPNQDGDVNLFCLDFDVVAHEVGHAIIFSEVGIPRPGGLTAQYLAFHESMADLVALLAAMEFDSVVERFLDQTGGNLYALSLLGRLAEMSDHEQVRALNFDARVGDFDGFVLLPDRSWYDPSGQNRTQHQLSQPLTAAVFAILIEIYQDGLVRRGLLDPDDDARGWSRAEVAVDFGRFRARFGRLLLRQRPAFRAALHDARHWVARTLALVFRRVPSNDLTFAAVAREFLTVARERGVRRNLAAFRHHFLIRDIDPDLAPAASPERPGAREAAMIADDRMTNPMPGLPRAALERFAALRSLMSHEFRAAPSW